jgi:hypothetical protein
MRLNFEFTQEQVKELKDLQRKTGCATMKDLFNNALSVLEWTVDESMKGNEIAAINESDRNYRVLVAPVLQAAAKQATRRTVAQPELQEA